MTSVYENLEKNKNTAGTAVIEEIDHFATLATEWWDPDGEFRSLHKINPIRIKYIRDQICYHFGRSTKDIKPLSGLSILDVGCGGGLICEPLTRLGANVTGIDAVERSIKIAKNHSRSMSLDIDYRAQLPEELDATEEKYDVLINMEVIEHVKDVEVFMNTCVKLIQPGGYMIASTINRTLKSFALAKIGAEYILRWVPIGTHDWQKFVRPSEFCYHIRTNGMSIEDITGIKINILQDSWELTKDLDINYLITAKKPL